MKKNRISYILYCIIVVLIIYQDSPLAIYMGAFGYSMIPTISILMLVILTGIKRKLYINSFVKSMAQIFIYLCLISIISLIVWIIVGGEITILNENIFVKSIKVLLYFFSYISFLVVIDNMSRKFSEREFLKPIFVVFMLITLICLIEYFTLPYAFSPFHFTGEKYYGRIRLLSKESSWTAMTIYVYGVLSFYYVLKVKKKLSLLLLTILCFFTLIAMSSSKTLMAIIFISLAVLLGINSKKMSKKSLTLSIVILIMFFAVYELLANKLANAVQVSLQWSSIYTRVYTTLIGGVIGIRYPFGTGTALYLSIFPEYLNKYYYFLNGYNVGYALREINSFINTTSDTAVAVKSGLLQYNMYWGILGTIVFTRMLLKKVYLGIEKSSEKYSIILRVSFIVTMIMLFLSSEFTFEFWLLISFILFKTEHQK